jgi:WD40 repeat protein/tetratricopeptide (TPR) repeat protein
MSLANRPSPTERALLAAGTASYDCPDFPDLSTVPNALQDVVSVLEELGFAAVARSPGYHLDPVRRSLRAAVRQAAAAAPVVVVYYTGHGADVERGTYYLVSKDSRPADLEESGVAVRDLLALLTLRDDYGVPLGDQPTALVILDCCQSSSAAMTMLEEALRGIGNPNTWVIASAGRLEYALQGLFAKAFCDALQRPTAGPSQRNVSLDSIVQAVNDVHVGRAQQQARLFPPAIGSIGIPPFFPNVHYQPGLAGLTVADQRHWLSRARGGPEESTTGFYLTGKTGRLRAAENLVAWMTDPGPKGLAVVTGSPGAGKSAQLALPVLLTATSRRDDLLRAAKPSSLIRYTAALLPADTPVTAIHARGLNTDQAASVIAQALGREGATASALLEDLDDTPEQDRRIVIVDAVDEATSPATLLGSLLVPLTRQPGLQVVVGARRHVLSAVGDTDLIIDLDADEYQDPEALTEYVHQLLIASEEPGVTSGYARGTTMTGGEWDKTATAMAAAIVRRATARDGRSQSFLLARLLALSARNRIELADISSERWQSELPTSVAEAFDDDLARLKDKTPLARTLLTALAWAKGPGLPWENIWVPVARALAKDIVGTDYPPVTEEDVRWLLGKAGAYIVEDLGPAGRSVYRPFHELLAAHLRSEPNTERDGDDSAVSGAWQQRRAKTERAITDALLASVPEGAHGRDWRSCHPYLRTYLAEHASAAGPETFSALVQDADFLAAADPATLIPLVYLTGPQLRDVARVYRRARPLLGDDLHANTAYLQEATRAITGAAASGIGIRPLYRTHCASVRLDESLLTLTGHTGSVESVAFGTAADGRLLLASGSQDYTVRVWDPVAGAPAGEPLTGHTDIVNSVAFGTGTDGRLLLASGSHDHTVRVWDAVTGAPIGEPLTGHTNTVSSVAFGTGPGGQLLLASGGWDEKVRVWDPLTGAPIGEPLTNTARSVAFGTGPGGRLLLASGGWDEKVRVWDPLAGAPIGEPLDGHTDVVLSVAFGADRDGRLLLVSGSADSTVRLWDPITGAPLDEPLTGARTDPVTSVAFGIGPDGRLLLARGSWDETVPLWDAVTGAPVGEPLTGHTGSAWSVAFGTDADGRLLLASGSEDHTVRVWDPNSGVPAGVSHTGQVRASPPTSRHSMFEVLSLLLPFHSATDTVVVALGAPSDGRLLLASSGSRDQTARVWDAITGTPVGEPLTGHADSVTSLAFGATPDGRLLLASGDDRAVRVWDAITGIPVGEPLTGHVDSVTSLAFGATPDGPLLLASGSADRTAWLWDPATGALLGALIGHGGSVTSVAFGTSPDGRLLLASGSGDHTVRVWDAVTGAPLGEPLTGHTNGVKSVAFGTSPNGHLLLASGSDDRTVRLWNPVTGVPVGEPLTGHTGFVTSVTFGTAPDGRLLLASGGADHTVRLWDPTTGTCTVTLKRRSKVYSIASIGLALAIGDDEGISVIELDEQVEPWLGFIAQQRAAKHVSAARGRILRAVPSEASSPSPQLSDHRESSIRPKFHIVSARVPSPALAQSTFAAKLDSLGRYAEAEAACREAIRLDPSLAIAHTNLGVALICLGRYAEAEAACLEAIRLDPSLAIAHTNLGAVRGSLGRFAEAEAACREAIRLDPSLAIAHTNLGVALSNLGRFPEAEAACREALRLDPDHAPDHSNLGDVLGYTGRYAEAEAAYREALRLDPNLGAAHNNLGHLCLRLMGRVSEAEAALREAVRCDPDDVAAYANLGSLHVAAGDLDAARSSFLRAAQNASPGIHPFSELMLGVLEQQTGTAAEAHYAAALQALDQSSRTLTYLSPFRRAEIKALALVGLGRPAEAADVLSRAAELRSEGDVFQAKDYELFIAAIPGGRLDALLKIWDQLIAKDKRAAGPWGNPFKDPYQK